MCVIQEPVVHTRVGVDSPVQSPKKDAPRLHLLLSFTLYFETGSLSEPGTHISLAKVPGEDVCVSIGRSWLYRHAFLCQDLTWGVGI